MRSCPSRAPMLLISPGRGGSSFASGRDRRAQGALTGGGLALAAWKRRSPAVPSARFVAKSSRAARCASASSALRSVNHKPAVGQRKVPARTSSSFGSDAHLPTAGGENCRCVAAPEVFPDEHASVDRGLEQGKVQVQQEENRERGPPLRMEDWRRDLGQLPG
jgi:hypothetical protein